MAAFSTPFWAVVTGAAVLSAGVAYLARPFDAGFAGRAATAGESALPLARLADVVLPPDPDDAPPRSLPPRPARPFTLDPLGRLVVSVTTLPVLDSWLAMVGIGQPIALLEARLRAELPPLAAERAWPLLLHYAAYREAERDMLVALKAQGTVAPRELLDKTMALRRRHFDTVTVEELFGVQEARALYASEVARILADKGLGEAQQAQRLMTLRMGLPPEVAAQEFGGAGFSVAMERIAAQMREEGESDDEVLFRRRQFVDVEGAKSLVEIEREQFEVRQQAWALRHPNYVRQRDELLATADLDEAERQQRLDELLRQHFKSDEIADARLYGLR